MRGARRDESLTLKRYAATAVYVPRLELIDDLLSAASELSEKFLHSLLFGGTK